MENKVIGNAKVCKNLHVCLNFKMLTCKKAFYIPRRDKAKLLTIMYFIIIYYDSIVLGEDYSMVPHYRIQSYLYQIGGKSTVGVEIIVLVFKPRDGMLPKHQWQRKIGETRVALHYSIRR